MQRRGYTLIELLVALALLTLIASAIVPTYQLILAQFELSSATNQAADFVRLAEQKTVTEQQIYGVTLTAGATTIPQYLYNPATHAKTAKGTLTLPSNISIGTVNFSGTTDIMFSTSGAPNVSGDFTVADSSRGKTQDIEVRPSGGVFTNGEQ